MRESALALALLVCATAPATTQQTVDTALTIQGFLQRDNEFDQWTIVVPLPLRVLGQQTYVVPVVGKPERWADLLHPPVEPIPLRNRQVEGRNRRLGHHDAGPEPGRPTLHHAARRSVPRRHPLP